MENNTFFMQNYRKQSLANFNPIYLLIGYMVVKLKKKHLKPHDISGFLYTAYKLWEIWQK